MRRGRIDVRVPWRRWAPVLAATLVLVSVTVLLPRLAAASHSSGSVPLPAVDAQGDAGAGAIVIEVGDDIQAAVDSNPPGTTFVIRAGVHRLQSITPKDGDTFLGDPGAVLSGAEPLTQFAREGGLWVASDQSQEGRASGTCVRITKETRYDGCVFPNDLFIDDEMLWQVTSLADVEPGTWYFDYAADKIYFSDDPTGRTVEASIGARAFSGAATGVTIRGLVVEKYANPAQRGAIDGSQGADWVVEGNEIRLNHGRGLYIGQRMQVLGNFVHHNGQLGIGGIGDDVLVQGNEIAFNNTAGFAAGWEAGGTKFIKTRNLVVRGNHVHDNNGPGLWTDIDNIDSLIEDNLVEWNTHKGIQHEISYAAVIRNNQVHNNGLGFDPWLWGAQILVQNSSDVEVYGNVVTVPAAGGDGIAVINQDRGAGLYGPRISANVYVHDNEITHLGNVGASGVADDTPDHFACSATANNRFEGNTYYVPDAGAGRWQWCGGKKWDAFQASNQELDGTVHETS